MKAGVSQWIGTRAEQEDAYRIRFFPEGLLAVVCDGMGGHHHGALAADKASASFVEAFGGASLPVSERLLHALTAANRAVGCLTEKSSLFGGTTLVAAYVSGGVVRWISVGDSALLLWRRGRLLRLNADHSMRPLLNRVAASESDASNILRSALTGDRLELIDSPATPIPLLPGDRLILSTDGAERILSPGNVAPDVCDVLNARSENDASALVELLCREALPEADNATVLVVDV